MTDLSGISKLVRQSPHLPLSTYFDPELAKLEEKILFASGATYAGHRLMVPSANDYRVPETHSGGWALVNNGQSVELVSNVCRHRQAKMLDGAGQLSGAIVCPLHRWTYDMKGELIGAPHFPTQPCLNLPRKPLQEWNGLLFSGARNVLNDLGKTQFARDLSFEGFVFDRAIVHEYAFNWKTFIEVYLEDYHVEPFHPGLGSFVNCDDLKWEFGDWYSVQSVGVKQSLMKPGTDTYKKWHEVIKNFRNGEDPPHGAIWLTYYPGVMVEWYPHVLVVSTLIPRGPEACTNVVEFYYPEEIFHFEREFIEAEQAAYAETAVEDEEICMRMTQGRKLLWQEGREEHGPYQSPLEDGMQHFHEWYRRAMQDHANL